MPCYKLSRHAKSKPHPTTKVVTSLPTIAEAIRQTEFRLLSVGIPSDEAAIEARIMLQHVSGLTQSQLLANYNDQLADCALPYLNEIIARRETREPLAYIIGEKEFYGRMFQVDDRVLIPRPETELLIDLCTRFVDQNSLPRPEICDIGTGSGIIAITLAKEIPHAIITATDISADALELAKTNAANHRAKIRFKLQDVTNQPGRRNFNVVVSNPPYIKTRTLENLQPEVTDWEPRQALDGGTDGMSILEPLIQSLPDLLRDDEPSAAFIEIDPPVVEACLATARAALPDAEIQIHRDYAGLERILVALRL